MPNLTQGTLVRNTGNDKAGVVINDTFGCCSPNEVLVAYNGNAAFGQGTDVGELKVIGQYAATPDMQGCGGANACIFLGAGREGLTCLRFTRHHHDLWLRAAGGKMRSTRHPVHLYPDCKVIGNGHQS